VALGPPQSDGFFCGASQEEYDGWMVFVCHNCFPGFWMPAIDELYRRRTRRAANLAQKILLEPISLVPDQNEHLPVSRHGSAELEVGVVRSDRNGTSLGDAFLVMAELSASNFIDVSLK
jgi:hypothetical protein